MWIHVFNRAVLVHPHQFVSGRNPNPVLAVGIHIIQLLVGQSHHRRRVYLNAREGHFVKPFIGGPNPHYILLAVVQNGPDLLVGDSKSVHVVGEGVAIILENAFHHGSAGIRPAGNPQVPVVVLVHVENLSHRGILDDPTVAFIDRHAHMFL